MISKIYEVWCEGDPKIDTTACHLGIGKGITFTEACVNLVTKNPYYMQFFDFDNLTYKNCRLFPTEEEARVRYG